MKDKELLALMAAILFTRETSIDEAIHYAIRILTSLKERGYE